jgi:hypothetical protein
MLIRDSCKRVKQVVEACEKAKKLDELFSQLVKVEYRMDAPQLKRGLFISSRGK